MAQQTPMPLDINQLANALGQAQLTILQLQYQVRMLSDELLARRDAQAKFDAAVDARDMPSGATAKPDEFRGD